MKKIIYLIFILILLNGCASLSEKGDIYLNNLEKHKHYKEIVVNSSYDEAFSAAIEVFRDLGINVLKKDYENKKILGSLYPEHYWSHYGVFFSDVGDDKTKITLKATGFLINEDTILEKIKETLSQPKLMNR
ncbi:MAG: hypothetical protein M0R48_04320 [Candidatus Omnitrophica bacterium]|jgi:hypothetical protein|nr:hypothetical protein [Candidatus Omnitrophota bacterium]